MSRKHVVYAVASLLFAASHSLAQQASKAFPFLESLDVFSGTFEGTAVIPSGTTDSERLGEIQGKKVTVIETRRWAPGRCAQIVDVSYTIDGSETILGTTLIGWDGRKKKITTSQFTTHKGVWSGTMEKEGSKWITSYEGYNLDGKKGTGKHIVTFTDADHYTLIETDLTLDGKSQPDATWHFKRL